MRVLCTQKKPSANGSSPPQDTVCSVALACRSHSSTSPPGLIFTQTHSWAQPCPAHWQYCDAKSQLSQHID